jgi:hypothetical protein
MPTDVAANNDEHNGQQRYVVDNIVNRQTNGDHGESHHTQPVPAATVGVVAHCSHGSRLAPRQIALA